MNTNNFLKQTFLINPKSNVLQNLIVFKHKNKIILNVNNNQNLSFIETNFKITEIEKNILFLHFDENNPNIKSKKALLNSFFFQVYPLLKGLSQGFFLKFKIMGLGFKLKKILINNERYLQFELGYSHIILYKIPNNFNIFVKKRNFILFSDDLFLLNKIANRIMHFRKANAYKEKGILYYDQVVKLKSGKQQQK